MPTRKEILQTKINTDLATGTSITASEHRGVESAIINASVPVNRGGFFLGNIQSVTGALSIFGDITSANAANDFASIVTINFATSMNDNNYMIKIFPESMGTMYQDVASLCPMFKIINSSSAYIIFKEPYNETQSIKVHLEIVSLNY